MNQELWQQGSDLFAMLRYAEPRASSRKLHLFACACCRLRPALLSSVAARNAVEGIEECIDREKRPGDFRYPDTKANLVVIDRLFTADGCTAAKEVLTSLSMEPNYSHRFERKLVEALREIIGNPFAPADFSRDWLTSDVQNLAQSAYDERLLPSGRLALDRLAVLSDALKEAGCDDDDDILKHLSSTGPHVRGCWVIDLLLGRS